MIPPASSAENPSHSIRTSASRWERGSEASASSTSSRAWPTLCAVLVPTRPLLSPRSARRSQLRCRLKAIWKT